MFGVRLVMFGAQALFVGDTLAGVPTRTRYDGEGQLIAQYN